MALHRRWLRVAVWVARVAVGLVFIVSGFAKAVDPWGFIYKIEEYLTLWGMTQPRSLVLTAAVLISGSEFVFGCMLAVGNYKRTAVWYLLAMMAVMLPLTGYIFLYDPVPDCGCFGDFLVVSNGMTFLKNIVITAALVYLAVYNRRVAGLFGAYVQWLTALICSVYILVIALMGYNIQPMVDFRSFAAGRSLVVDEGEEDTEEVKFIYEKDGQRQTFDMDNLPDSTWTYVDRVAEQPVGHSATDFVVMDGDQEVTADIINPEGEQLLVLIPEYERADVAYTYLINELNGYMLRRGGSLVEIVAADQSEIAQWTDLSMAEYPVYSAESTMLKEMARGTISVVGLRDGVIQWKRTASSIDQDVVAAGMNDDGELFEALDFDGPRSARNLTLAMLSVMAVIFLLDRSGRLLKWSRWMKDK